MSRLGWKTVTASLALGASLGTLGARVNAPDWAASWTGITLAAPAERLCRELERSGHGPMQDTTALALVGICGRARR